IASNILSGFKLKANQMPKVADVLTATLTRSNVDLRMLGETMTYVAPIASKFGASIEEASALAGMLGNVGIQGSMAGTAMRTMYNNIASHTPAIKALEELGIQSRLEDGNMRALPEILSEIAEKTESMGAGQQLEIFKLIAGKEAGAAFAELVSQSGSAEISKFMQVLKGANGEAARIAAQMADNTAGDIKAMQSAWEGLSISIASTNTSPLRQMIQGVTRIISRVNTWVQQNPELAGQLLHIVAFIGAAVTVGGALALAIAGTLGPLAMMTYSLRLMWIQTLASSTAMKSFLLFIGGGVLKAVASIARITKATWLMNIALNANPIGLMMTGIAALIGIGWLLYNNWEKVSAGLGKAFDWLREKFSWIDKTAKVVGGLWDAVFGNEETEKTLKLNQQIQRETVNPKTANQEAFNQKMANQNAISPAKQVISGSLLAASMTAPAVAYDAPLITTAQSGASEIQKNTQHQTPITKPALSPNVSISYGDVNIYASNTASSAGQGNQQVSVPQNNNALVALIHEEWDRREAQALSRVRSRLYD
ncbi:phage tail tape measure protein, partial [Alteromonas sp. a30]|uniref:phage tail tape measure protein n=1 Tax=Alteromonas sp. a30 TaxID=2730917 RepID=UPI00227F9D37